MSTRKCLVLTQYRNGSEYNDFIGHYYHFPNNSTKNYSAFFKELPLEFIYYEPTKHGDGVFYGYGKIEKEPFPDKRETGFSFVEISDYKTFETPVSAKNLNGEFIEKIANPTSYNSSNAVRHISSEFLDGVCLDGGIILNFESDSHLVRVLGEQLIGSEKVGILELVKNTIDANAQYCRVRIEQLPNFADTDYKKERPDLSGPVIIIEDNGIGMSREIIEKGWLRPASILKTNVKEQLHIERKKASENGSLAAYNSLYESLKKLHGRIPLGEKGVGRFATHRLGRYLELRTKEKGSPFELVMSIDWQKFDLISSNPTNLNSIGIVLRRQIPSRDYGDSDSGTVLTISGGREGFFWDEKSIRELNDTLLTLNAPSPPEFKKKNCPCDESVGSFNVKFECPQLEELKTEPIYQESTANFIMDLLVDENGLATYDIKFSHPHADLPSDRFSGENVDLRIPSSYKSDEQYWFTIDKDIKRQPACGDFFAHIEVWYRKKEWIDLADYNALIDYLDNFGGIAIYRDGILTRESSIGSMTDWLGLAQAHIRQGFRISYRDMIGYVELTQKNNQLLLDKTSREGFIENEAYKDLCVLLRNAIDYILLSPYKAKRDEYAKLKKGVVTDTKLLQSLATTGAKFFSNIAESDYPMDSDPYNFFDNLWMTAAERKGGIVNLQTSMKQLKASIKMLEDVQEVFVEKAGFGLAVAVSLHELNKIVSNFYHGVNHLLQTNQLSQVTLEDLKASSDSLKSELKRLSPLRAIRNESAVEFQISRSIKFAKAVYQRKMDEFGISFDIINPEDDFTVVARYSAVNQIFCNIFDNAIYWIKYATPNKKQAIKELLK